MEEYERLKAELDEYDRQIDELRKQRDLAITENEKEDINQDINKIRAKERHISDTLQNAQNKAVLKVLEERTPDEVDQYMDRLTASKEKLQENLEEKERIYNETPGFKAYGEAYDLIDGCYRHFNSDNQIRTLEQLKEEYTLEDGQKARLYDIIRNEDRIFAEAYAQAVEKLEKDAKEQGKPFEEYVDSKEAYASIPRYDGHGNCQEFRDYFITLYSQIEIQKEVSKKLDPIDDISSKIFDKVNRIQKKVNGKSWCDYKIDEDIAKTKGKIEKLDAVIGKREQLKEKVKEKTTENVRGKIEWFERRKDDDSGFISQQEELIKGINSEGVIKEEFSYDNAEVYADSLSKKKNELEQTKELKYTERQIDYMIEQMEELVGLLSNAKEKETEKTNLEKERTSFLEQNKEAYKSLENIRNQLKELEQKKKPMIARKKNIFTKIVGLIKRDKPKIKDIEDKEKELTEKEASTLSLANDTGSNCREKNSNIARVSEDLTMIKKRICNVGLAYRNERNRVIEKNEKLGVQLPSAGSDEYSYKTYECYNEEKLENLKKIKDDVHTQQIEINKENPEVAEMSINEIDAIEKQCAEVEKKISKLIPEERMDEIKKKNKVESVEVEFELTDEQKEKVKKNSSMEQSEIDELAQEL